MGTTPPARDTTLREGWSVRAAQAAWLVVVGTAVAISTYGFIEGFRDPARLETPHVAAIFESLGIDLRFAIAIALALPYLLFLVAFAIVVAKRPRDWMALLFSAAIICLETFLSVVSIIPLEAGGLLRWVTLVILNLAWVGMIAVLFLFPSGRFHPPWARYAAPVLAAAVVAFGNAPEHMLAIIRPERARTAEGQAATLVITAAIAVGMYAQWKRYRRVSTETERQQAKWVTFPLGVSIAYFTLAFVIPSMVVDLSDQWLGWVAVTAIPIGILFPVAVAVALLRYRLHDIDLVISKTVVYGGLAFFLTLVYVSLVVGIGSLFGGGDEPNVALSIIATAVVAVAFQPVRSRLTDWANRLVFGERRTPYEVLARFANQAGQAIATEEALDELAQLLAAGTGAAHTEVSLVIDGEMRPAASVGDRAAPGESHGVHVVHRDEVLGRLSVTKPRDETLTAQDRELVDGLAAQVGLLLRNVRLNEDLRQKVIDLRSSRQRLVSAQDSERRRLERDLHDGAQQQIVAVKMKLGVARALAEREGAAKAAEVVGQLADEVDACVQTLRELAHGIYPPLLAAEGLPAALRAQAAKAAVPVEVEADGVGRHDEETEAAVYFVVLEAIQNAAKYGRPNRVAVGLSEIDGGLRFTVSDDGEGFDVSQVRRGHGTTNMVDRIDALGGTLEIISQPGEGTVITGVVPSGAPTAV